MNKIVQIAIILLYIDFKQRTFLLKVAAIFERFYEEEGTQKRLTFQAWFPT